MTQNTTQNRFKSWVVWGEVVTWIITGLQLFGVFERLGLDAGQIQDYIIMGLKLGWSIFAAVNVPTNAKGI